MEIHYEMIDYTVDWSVFLILFNVSPIQVLSVYKLRHTKFDNFQPFLPVCHNVV